MIKKIKNALVKKIHRLKISKVRKDANPVRWGVIGLGYMAEKISTAIDSSKSGIVYAVASRSLVKAIQFSKAHGNCKAYGSYEDMINDEHLNLDVVYIATPVKYHYDHIKLCLEAGKNVMCEKPITTCASQLEELQKIAESKKCFLMEGMWMKCLPSFRQAVKWLREEKIGNVNLLKVDFYKREILSSQCAIYNIKEGGGVLLDYGVYTISFIIEFLKGVPTTIYASKRTNNQELDTDWFVHVKRDGIEANINISSDFSSLSKAAVIGSNGSIEWDSQFNRTNAVSLYDLSGKLVNRTSFKYCYEGFEYEIEEVHRCVKAGKVESELVTIKSSLDTLKTIDLLFAQTGQK